MKRMRASDGLPGDRFGFSWKPCADCGHNLTAHGCEYTGFALDSMCRRILAENAEEEFVTCDCPRYREQQAHDDPETAKAIAHWARDWSPVNE